MNNSFVVADSAPLMVTLARVNMAILGAPKREYIMGKKDEATAEFHGGKAICQSGN